jgi:predicted metalloenzyme YecM
MTKTDFYSQATQFLDTLFAQMRTKKISLQPHWSIDHLCYRANSAEGYLRLRNLFTDWSTLLIESEVNGRMIATFKLHKPVVYQGSTINLVELPAPKKGKVTIEGFEHIEVVCDVPLERIKTEFSHCRFDESGLAKPFNQELEIPLNQCALKFHYLSLESVIRLEKNKRVYQAILDSKVLEILKPYKPLVAGTFPLDLALENSDVDIILTAADLESLSQFLQGQFSLFSGFKAARTDVNGEPSLTVNFTIGDVPFELFAQRVESVEQRAYLHFQVEERLLGLADAQLAPKILALRRTGAKTEPAFAQILRLAGDPYQALLELQKKTDFQLAEIIQRSGT